MSEASQNGMSAPPEVERRLDLTCRRFESAWKGRPRIEDYLEGWPEPARSALLRELLRLEVQFRRRRGETCKIAEYQQRFPALDAAWLGYIIAAPLKLSSDSATDVSGLLPPLQDCEVLGPLGRGGMSEVFRAWQDRLKREVALKMVRTNAGPREVELFRREAEAVARLKHVNIVQIYDIGERDGRPCLVLELIKGESLYDGLDGRPQPGKAAAQLVQVLARAIHHAHQQGVIHCDLKPGNVLLAADGTPKITDFGVSRYLESAGQPHDGRVVGTPDYIAPEQAAARTDLIGPPTDVYALGAILYELITGWPPFKGATRKETLRRVCSAQPIPPSLLQSHVHPDLETIVLKCLQKQPQDRYASAEELADDLGRFLAHEPIRARPLNVLQRITRLLERPLHLDEVGRWGPATIADAALALACHGVLFALIRMDQAVGLLWVWLLLSTGLGLWLFWHLLTRRGGLTDTERDLRNLWVGYAVAGVVLCWLYCPPFSGARAADALHSYPPLAVVVGVILFAEGRMYWGRLYLLGLAFFALALLMPLVLAWSPLLLGGLYALTILYMGHHGRRAALAEARGRLK